MALTAMLLSGLLPSYALAQYTTCTAANPNDNVSDDIPLNQCLAQGGTIDLYPGQPGYIIQTGLTLSVNSTRFTNTHGGYAALIAHQTLGQAMLNAGASGYEISNLGFDGRVRDAQGNIFRSMQASCNGYRGRFSNLLLRGANFRVRNSYSIQALCGSAIEVDGAGFEIAYNVIANNGTAYDEPYSGGDPWADGITLLACNGGYVHGNFLWDNTDIDLVVGGGQNCRIESNRIDHTVHSGFAGIHVGYFPNAAGNHSGSLYSGHDIVANAVNKLAFGIVIGSHPWDPGVLATAPNVSSNLCLGGRRESRG